MTQYTYASPQRSVAKPVVATVMTFFACGLLLCTGFAFPLLASVLGGSPVLLLVAYFSALGLAVAGTLMLSTLPRYAPGSVACHVIVIVATALALIAVVPILALLMLFASAAVAGDSSGSGQFHLSIFAIGAPVWLPLVGSVLSLSLQRAPLRTRVWWVAGVCGVTIVIVLIVLAVALSL